MLRYILVTCVLTALQLNAAKVQAQSDIRFDSCTGVVNPVAALLGDVIMRPQTTARWKDSKPLDQAFQTWLLPYLQKSAGGNITLSLLIFPDGRCCLYRVQPNSNVRPDYVNLKKQVEQVLWAPAHHNNEPVLTTKVIQLAFNGKKLAVRELQ